MARETGVKVDRRKFLAGVAVAGAATSVSPPSSAATVANTPAGEALVRRPSALRPSASVVAAEIGVPKELPRATRPDGSDFMVDVIKTLDIEYCPSNAASSFRGLHESLNNYGGNKKPEFLTVMHEESGVAMGHGYFKITGKPMMTLCHGTVGLQHASMDPDRSARQGERVDLPIVHDRKAVRILRTGRHLHEPPRHAAHV